MRQSAPVSPETWELAIRFEYIVCGILILGFLIWHMIDKGRRR